MRIDVSIDRSLLTFGDRLSKLASKVPKAAAEGLNEGGDLLRTPVRRDLREQTGVKAYRSITSRTSTKRAHPGNLVDRIEGTGKGMPIKEFPVRASVRRPVTAMPWGVSHTFARSFMTSGQRLLRARLGAARLPVRALYGPAVSKEIVKGETASHFQAKAASTVERTVMKRLVRLVG